MWSEASFLEDRHGIKPQKNDTGQRAQKTIFLVKGR